MPIGGIKPTTVVNKGSTNAGGSSGPGNGGRTTFRPPWVKADNPDTIGKTVTSTTTKTNAPWMRKTETTKENGQTKNTPAPKQIAAMPSAPRKEVKLQSREIKVPIITEKPKPVQVPLKPREKVVKPPTPEESEEDESEEEETETESETEEEESEEETELTKKFKMSKANPRPVVVKRDKSFSSAKKTEDSDAAAQEEEERQRRFKLERPKLRHVVVNKEKPLTNKSTDDFGKIRPVLKKIPKIDENKATPDTEPEFKDKVLKKVPPIKRNDSIVNNVPVPPPLPSLIPKPPPPPPLQLAPPNDFEKNPLSDRQKKSFG